MKVSEFYEKYWKITDKKGNLVSPPKLTGTQKDFLDKAADGNSEYVMFFGRRRRPIQINIQYLIEDYKKMPKCFYPANQPNFDKYGNIKEEQ